MAEDEIVVTEISAPLEVNWGGSPYDVVHGLATGKWGQEPDPEAQLQLATHTHIENVTGDKLGSKIQQHAMALENYLKTQEAPIDIGIMLTPLQLEEDKKVVSGWRIHLAPGNDSWRTVTLDQLRQAKDSIAIADQVQVK